MGLVLLRCKLLKVKGTKRKAEIPNPIPRAAHQKKVGDSVDMAVDTAAGTDGAGGQGEGSSEQSGIAAAGGRGGRGGKGRGRGGKGGRPPAAPAGNSAEGELKAKLLAKLMGNTS